MANESGSTNWFRMFQRGQHYMKTWPADKRLAPMFPENRVSSATRFAIRFMPPLAIFTLTWQIAMGGQLGPAVATALFACSLPMQGLWWLGKRSVTPLPPRLCLPPRSGSLPLPLQKLPPQMPKRLQHLHLIRWCRRFPQRKQCRL